MAPTVEPLHCPQHPSAALVEDHAAGDMICPACGLVVGDRVVDVTAEWRTFADSDKDPSRVGGREDRLLEGFGLSTLIAVDEKARDESGRMLYRSYSRLSGSRAALLSGFRKVSELVDRLGATTIVCDRAKLLLKRATESKRVKRSQPEALAAACVYVACHQEGVTRTFKEVCAISGVSVKVLSRCYHRLKAALGIQSSSSGMASAVQVVGRLCAQLQLPPQLHATVTHVCESSQEIDVFARRAPMSVVAGALSLVSQASGIEKSAPEVGEVAGVAPATVRQVHQEMQARVAHLFPVGSRFATPIHQASSS